MYMKINIAGKGIDLTEALKNTVNEKLNSISKYFTPDTVANVTLRTERGTHICEFTIPVKGNVIRIEHETLDMYKSIDEALEKVESQIKKYRRKIKDKKLRAITNDLVGEFMDVDVAEEEPAIKIVKKKQFLLKPMSAEEACMQAELVNHDFFLFKNADTGEVCAVYKRKDGAFGLIEPTFD